MAGPHGSAMPGQVVDLEETQALQLINGGYAQPVVEVAMTEPPENTDARPKAKPRGRK